MLNKIFKLLACDLYHNIVMYYQSIWRLQSIALSEAATFDIYWGATTTHWSNNVEGHQNSSKDVYILSDI